MTIKEVSEKYNIPADTLRYYEKVGVIPQGDETFAARLKLLHEQRENLLAQQKQLKNTMKKLNYKISKYEEAVETGKLVWD